MGIGSYRLYNGVYVNIVGMSSYKIQGELASVIPRSSS